MKNFLSVFLIVILCLSLTACGDVYITADPNSEIFSNAQDYFLKTAENSVSSDNSVISKASSDTAASETVISVSAADASPSATATGPFGTVTSTSSSNNVVITKSPTSETVAVGGACSFISYATNSTGISWYITDSNTSAIYKIEEAPSHISGLLVYGYNSNKVILTNIPSSMNGWKIQACFEGAGGPVYSDIAYIWTFTPTTYIYNDYHPAPPSCNECPHGPCPENPECGPCQNLDFQETPPAMPSPTPVGTTPPPAPPAGEA